MKTFLALLLSLLTAQAADLDFRDTADRDIVKQRMVRFLAAEGREPRMTEGTVLITDRGLHITHKPVVDAKGLDRIIITCGFPGTGKPTGAKYAAVNQLNEIFNTCAISLDQNGDVIFRFNLTFSDVLTGKEHREFMAFLHGFLGDFLDDPKTKDLRELIME